MIHSMEFDIAFSKCKYRFTELIICIAYLKSSFPMSQYAAIQVTTIASLMYVRNNWANLYDF